MTTGVNRIFNDGVPSTKTTAKGETTKSNDPSVFVHKYDKDTKGVYGEISAKELKIAEKLEAAQKTLNELAKSVSRSDVAATIKKLQSMSEALFNGVVKYSQKDSSKIDEITADCDNRIADAEKISKIVEQLKQNPTKGVETFERTTFSSQTTLDVLKKLEDNPGDNTKVGNNTMVDHNTKAGELRKQDKEQKVVAEVKAQMDELFNQQIEAYMEAGKDFNKANLRAVHAGISDIEIKAEIYSEANNLKGEYRDEYGRQVIIKDATEFTLTYMFHGKPHTIRKVVYKIAKGVNPESIRKADKGIKFTVVDPTEKGLDPIIREN